MGFNDRRCFKWINWCSKGCNYIFVFANVLFNTGMDPLGGIASLVDAFTNNGLTGLLVLVVFLSWL